MSSQDLYLSSNRSNLSITFRLWLENVIKSLISFTSKSSSFIFPFVEKHVLKTLLDLVVAKFTELFAAHI